MNRKECEIDWLGLNLGPAFVDVDGNPLENLTQRFFKQIDSDDLQQDIFGKKMKEFAEDQGWKVTSSIYDDQLDEDMSDKVAQRFRAVLKTGPVRFRYRKTDGSIRKALGTLDPKLVNHGEKVTIKRLEDGSRKHHVPRSVFVYWDLKADGFRSFKRDNFIGFKRVEASKKNRSLQSKKQEDNEDSKSSRKEDKAKRKDKKS